MNLSGCKVAFEHFGQTCADGQTALSHLQRHLTLDSLWLNKVQASLDRHIEKVLGLDPPPEVVTEELLAMAEKLRPAIP